MSNREEDDPAAKALDQREDLRSRAYHTGFLYEKTYRSCGQCTIAAVQDTLQIQEPSVVKAASALAAGGALLGDGVCGGYSGGILSMGMVFGRRRSNFDKDEELKSCAYRMARLLHGRFIREYGSVICQNVQLAVFGESYDLWQKSSKEKFERDGAHVSKCTDVVGKAASWAVDIMLDEAAHRGLDVDGIRKLSKDL